MKKYWVIILFFGVYFGAIPLSIAKQTNMPSYYPSSTGAYTKVLMINGAGGPDANKNGARFCLQTGVNPNTYDDSPINGHTYINDDTIFTDPTSGVLEICKKDGSVASYPGYCFNRYCRPSFGDLVPCDEKPTACPNNAQFVRTLAAGNNLFGSTARSYACCSAPNNSMAKAGCFSNFSPVGGNPPPYSCTNADSNAYDMGCQTITMASGKMYKRDCCFNNGGPNALGVVSPCV